MAAAADILIGDVRERLRALPAGHFHCVVTSPPYWGLRDYGVTGQIGSEATPDEFVQVMVEVFREVWRVLRDDGTLWLNLGDSYCSASGPGSSAGSTLEGSTEHQDEAKRASYSFRRDKADVGSVKHREASGLKPKDLCGMPFRVALALQADGWYWRDCIIWHKPAPMPESVRDRTTKAHEYVFLLTKRPRYFYDAEAIAEPVAAATVARLAQDVDSQAGSDRVVGKTNGAMKAVASRFGENAKSFRGGGTYTQGRSHDNGTPADRDSHGNVPNESGRRNSRSVWTIASRGYAEAHFATFPEELPRRCILAGTSAHGCCATCGAPWERVVERQKLTRERSNDLTKRTGEAGTGNHCGNTVAGVAVTTAGWRPTCECDGDVAPCRVLEPFCGSGTTLAVAIKHGRSAVGIELNPAYVELARKRIAGAVQSAPLFLQDG